MSVAEWSGGTTTQLAIWPKGADYAKRNFIWRVSSAKVEDEESVFTSLPGVSRCLMILDGQLRLVHEGHYDIRLGRFEQDNFDGGWLSRSYGRVTDFNLMTTSGEGRVQVVEVEPSTSRTIEPMPVVDAWECVSEVFYFLDGMELSPSDGSTLSVAEGDVLVLHSETGDRPESSLMLHNRSNTTAQTVRAVIYHPAR